MQIKIYVAICICWQLLAVYLAAGCVHKSHTDSTSSQNLQATYKTRVLFNEFIVQFKNYYWPATRFKYLNAVLHTFNSTNWQIIKRQNVASKYPSDFDVIKLITVAGITATPENILKTIAQHHAVKSITAQRSVERQLQYRNTENYTENVIVGRRLLRVIPKQIASALKANILWQHGIKGQGIRVAVFDTGLARNHPHFRVVKERTNWTNEKSLDDGVSHGTFVAGVIASAKECFGLAPEAELHIYRVFTNNQVSYTSWFLDAFNYALFKRINVLNLSIGGPDFLDRPFVDKVLELSANRVIMVSAIGNDGPQYGTLNNPGDQSDVIGVGGINFDDHVAKFSSRGMTTWELPHGYGRLKPDLVTYGSQVSGSNVRSGCRTLSGTSVAAPVVAGAIALLSSGVPHKTHMLNPASVKQVLLEAATRLPDNNMFEQGHGKLNLLQSMKLLLSYEPKVTLSPAYVDFAESYMWPYSSQQLYCDSTPVIINITILNGNSVMGRVLEPPQWHAYSDEHGHLLQVAITYSAILWPWSGWFAVHLAVSKQGCDFAGEARGHISLLVQPDASKPNETSIVLLPINVRIIAKPPRHKRLLWDQYHSLRYPPGYIPRDNLKVKSDPLDWRADHIHTNFRDTYTHLRSRGFYIDVLRQPFTCFNASEYNTLLIVDAEEEFHAEEINKLQHDVYELGLSIVVIADWYNASVMQRIKFFDENTRQWWIPDTGGANVPALNELLQPYGIAFGDTVGEGHYQLGEHHMYYASGVNIARFPQHAGNMLISAQLHDQGQELLYTANSKSLAQKISLPILGLLQTKRFYKQQYMHDQSPAQAPQANYDKSLLENAEDMNLNSLEQPVIRENNPILNKRILLQADDFATSAETKLLDNDSTMLYKNDMEKLVKKQLEGRIVVFGDSNCLDSAFLEKPCFWLLDAILSYTTQSHRSKLLQQLNRITNFKPTTHALPLRLPTSNMHQYSKVLNAADKFKQRTFSECEHISWHKPNFVNDNSNKVGMPLQHIAKDNDLPFLKNMGMPEVQIGDMLEVTPSRRLEDIIIRPMVVVYILTFIVLAILVKHFKSKRNLKIFKF